MPDYCVWQKRQLEGERTTTIPSTTSASKLLAFSSKYNPGLRIDALAHKTQYNDTNNSGYTPQSNVIHFITPYNTPQYKTVVKNVTLKNGTIQLPYKDRYGMWQRIQFRQSDMCFNPKVCGGANTNVLVDYHMFTKWVKTEH